MSVWTELNGLEFSVRWLQVGPWRTRVLEAGLVAGQGPALVLMHGTGGHLEAYNRNLAALAQHFRVVAYDYPGQGFTTVTDHDLEIADYVEHLTGLLDALGIEKTHLCGESLGGWVAISFAARAPERVDRIVLNTPGGTMATPEVMERIRSLTQAAVDKPTPARVRARLEWLMADPTSVTDELVEIRQKIYSRPGFSGSMRHVLCLQDPEIRARNLVTKEMLAAVRAPALVVWTSNDPSGPAAAGMEMAERLPRGEFAFIADAGHWPQWERPGVYDGLMVDFLRRDLA